MRNAILLALLCMRPWPCAGQSAGQNREQQVRELIESLPRYSTWRKMLEHGARGDGIRRPWMDEMREQGVKLGGGVFTSQGLDRHEGASGEPVAMIVSNLPAGSMLRNELELGRRGDGIRKPWMDEMRRHGIKQASAGVRIAWWKDTVRPRLSGLSYFAEYDRPDSRIESTAKLAAIRRDEVDTHLSEVMEHAALTYSVPPTLDEPCRELGISVFDNEWLPEIAAASDIGAATFPDIVREGSLDGVKAALNSGADVNEADDCGRTGLFDASARPEVRLSEILLERGPNPGIRDQDGWTPLLNAAWYDRTAEVALLLERGATVNGADNDGQTALMVAATKGNANVVKALLAAHADLDTKDRSGRTALSLAEANGHKAVVELLRGAGARQ